MSFLNKQEEKGFSRIFLIVIGCFSLIIIGIFLGVCLNKNADNSLSTTLRSPVRNTENLSTNSSGSWKSFTLEGFTLLVPSDWEQQDSRHIQSANNKLYNLTVDVVKKGDVKDARRVALLDQGRLREYEQSICEGNATCGVISQVKNVDFKNGKSLQFVTTFSGINAGEMKGERKEIHQIVVKGDKIYRFWTSEGVPSKDMESQYPKLDPVPTELFQEIMKTLKID